MTRIAGSTVLLTGGSRGIGPVLAEALAARGARLALAARSAEGLQKTAAMLERYGVEVFTCPADLSLENEWEPLVQSVLGHFGKVDILVNNAGLESEGACLECPWEKIRQTLEVNLAAPLALTRLVLPQMLERGSGHIVNICSIASKGSSPYDSIYGVTKAGLESLNRSLRLELAGSGVKFSNIHPGYITGVGMFARFGVRSPLTSGSCTPGQVARAVVRAIERNRLELIINTPPLRYLFVIYEAWPELADWLMQVSGAVDFQRRKVANSQLKEVPKASEK